MLTTPTRELHCLDVVSRLVATHQHGIRCRTGHTRSLATHGSRCGVYTLVVDVVTNSIVVGEGVVAIGLQTINHLLGQLLDSFHFLANEAGTNQCPTTVTFTSIFEATLVDNILQCDTALGAQTGTLVRLVVVLVGSCLVDSALQQGSLSQCEIDFRETQIGMIDT